MKKVNVIPFNGMVRDKIMTKTMCEKAAASGLTFNHLKCAFARNGYDGLLLHYEHRKFVEEFQ
jgi:hypothetical protein